MASDANLSWKTRGMGRPEGKPRVFLTCHPDDSGRYLDEVCGYVLDACDCAIYYTEDMRADLSSENNQTDLGRMNLFVVPVTFKLLTTRNRAMDEDVPFAKEHHIAILPLMMEHGIESLYSEPKRFGELQYLDPYSNDATALGFDEKLRGYLDSLLVGSELANRIRTAFDAYVFLSYRKRDRALANDLMRTIHDDPALEDVAIWFDEFLTPGESFRENIGRLMDESKLFTLLVTPNLLEKPNGRPNFVMGEEYPAAVKNGMTILPAEAVPTDPETLKGDYPGLPECLDLQDHKGRERFLDALRTVATSENNSPEHNYLIGLAYLNGIDVERDSVRALHLLERSAYNGFSPAMEKLCTMYDSGEGVALDYDKALTWAQRLYELRRSTLGDDHPDTIKSLSDLAEAQFKIGKYKSSCVLYERVYETSRRVLGEAHPDTLVSLGNLSQASMRAGDIKGAVEISERVYEAKKLVLGENHPSTLVALLNLAVARGGFGDRAGSLELHERVYEQMRRVFGEDDPRTLVSLSDLASAHRSVGDVAGGLRLSEQAYERRSRVLGEDHPDTLTSLSGLAAAQSGAGNYAQALELRKRVYEASVRILGENHPDTVNSLKDLALTYLQAGDISGGLELAERAHEQLKRVLGENHPDVTASLNGLAIMHLSVGDIAGGLKLSEQGYEQVRHQLGEDHPETLSALSVLANAHVQSGDVEGGLELYERAYEARKRVLGDNHSLTLASLGGLAATHFNIGNYSRALELSEQAYEASKRTLGEDHPETLNQLVFLVSVRLTVGADTGTLKLAKQAYEQTKRDLGEDHPQTILSLGALATAVMHEGDLEGAVVLYEEAYKANRRALGNDHLQTLGALVGLVSARVAIGVDTQTLELAQQAYEQTTRILGEDHPHTISALTELALAYGDIGDYAQAIELSEQLYERSKRLFGENYQDTIDAAELIETLKSMREKQHEDDETQKSQVEENSKDLSTKYDDILIANGVATITLGEMSTTDIRGLTELFGSNRILREYLGHLYEVCGVDPRISDMSYLKLLALNRRSSFFSRGEDVPDIYIMHANLALGTELIVIHNRDGSIFHFASRDSELDDVYCIWKNGDSQLDYPDIKVDQASVKAFKGNPDLYLYYTLASRFFELPKPKLVFIEDIPVID